jgi:HK97 family phage major capsid protein
MRFGAVVRALATGNRTGLSALERRALEEGSGPSGGYTTPEILAASFIDRVRHAMIVQAAGAQIVPMTSDVLHVARLGQPSDSSPVIAPPAWKAESADIDEYDLLLERVTFTARTLPILIKLSVELAEDSVNVDALIEQELAAALALELDRVALLGSGSAPEPRGIINQAGVATTDFGGVAPTDYDFLLDAIGRVWARNHTPTARCYNASLATAIAKFKSSADSQPLRVPEDVVAVPAFRTNQIPNGGTSPDDTTLIVGDFSQLLIGLRTSFRLEASRVSGDAFSKMQIHVRAYLRADVQLAHAGAFDVTTGVGL